VTPAVGVKIIPKLNFRSNQKVISFISTIDLIKLKKFIKKKVKIIRAIPLPPISMRKGPVPIYPPDKQVKSFFDKIGTTIQIKSEKSSNNFWATSGMMAPFYEMLKIQSDWLVKRGIVREQAQKYITSLFAALSEDSVINSKKNLKYLVAESQTPGGLNEQSVKELRKSGYYKSLEKTLNSILKRLNKV
jgi:pyrroline-5-carboxylate reductase